ncbi:MAG: glutathione S-transferase family protein, partial [Beijerinckiaceae bacterium]
MMILRSAPPSPFGRKVKIAAALLGLTGEINVVSTDTIDPQDPLREDNPLGKIPTLVIEDGTVIYDSRVIVEYLDMRAGGGQIIPKSGMERIRVQTLHALADGIMDAGILQIYEGRWRDPAKHELKWVEHQAGKVARALDYLEANPPNLEEALNIGHIAVACALGYLDLRFKSEWRAQYPKLTTWLAAFAAKVPAF